MGLQLSIQDEQILLLEPGEFLQGRTVVLRPPQLNTPGTGLIGSPEPGEDGFINARALIQPGLVPGRRVDLQAENIRGLFRIERVVYIGDTWGPDWYADIEAKATA